VYREDAAVPALSKSDKRHSMLRFYREEAGASNRFVPKQENIKIDIILLEQVVVGEAFFEPAAAFRGKGEGFKQPGRSGKRIKS
jgi:hypothetical protein